ncbi:MAG: SBBP repeat-containing protein [Leptospiraceae bacterium]|nr:SBBP repeat-containing protein [Leptospiraceae bacterium]
MKNLLHFIIIVILGFVQSGCESKVDDLIPDWKKGLAEMKFIEYNQSWNNFAAKLEIDYNKPSYHQVNETINYYSFQAEKNKNYNIMVEGYGLKLTGIEGDSQKEIFSVNINNSYSSNSGGLLYKFASTIDGEFFLKVEKLEGYLYNIRVYDEAPYISSEMKLPYLRINEFASITGVNFDSNIENNTVTINGIEMIASSVSDNAGGHFNELQNLYFKIPEDLKMYVNEQGARVLIETTKGNYTKNYSSLILPAVSFTYKFKDYPDEALITNESIYLSVPFRIGMDKTSLVAEFTSTLDQVTVEQIPQISGQTANNFTSKVSYKIESSIDKVSRYFYVNAYNGYFWKTELEFTNSSEPIAMTVSNDEDIYVLSSNGGYLGFGKYSKDGILLWDDGMNETFTIKGTGIVTDNNGNVYITGLTKGEINGELLNGKQDFFILKYSSTGTLLWTKLYGVANTTTLGSGISSDNSGNIYITGYTSGNLDAQVKTGIYDLFIAKYDLNGNRIWTRLLGGTDSYQYPKSIINDTLGNVYITGYSEGPTIDGLTVTSHDTFIVKYDSNGNKQWTRSLSGSSWVEGYSIISDSNNNIYITGSTSGDLNGQIKDSSYSGDSLFVAKYDSNGNRQWTRIYNAYFRGCSISIDLSGMVYVSTGNYIAKYDSSGVSQWKTRISVMNSYASYDYNRGLFVNKSGNIYYLGKDTYSDLIKFK